MTTGIVLLIIIVVCLIIILKLWHDAKRHTEGSPNKNLYRLSKWQDCLPHRPTSDLFSERFNTRSGNSPLVRKHEEHDTYKAGPVTCSTCGTKFQYAMDFCPVCKAKEKEVLNDSEGKS